MERAYGMPRGPRVVSRTRGRGVDVPWTAETNWKEALSDCPVSVVHMYVVLERWIK